jgi:hypothetical protein
MLRIFSVLAGLIFSNFQYIYASETPAQVLLSAFSSQCPSVVTRQVQGSLVNVQALSAVVQQFREDDQCFGAPAMSTVTNRYAQLYEEYEVYQNTRNSSIELEQKVALYTVLLNEPGLSATEQSFLENEILYAQADLVGIEAEQGRFGQLSSRYAQGGDQTLRGLTDFLGSWSSQNACFSPRRSLTASLLSNSLMATSAFAAPATSLALAAGGLIVESVSGFLNDFKFNGLISDLDDAQMPLALSCVSEALTDQYCQAHETQELINAYRNDSSSNDSRFLGLDLLSRHMDRLGFWLQEVFAGSAITSQGDLVNREKPILQAELLEKVKRYAQTYGTIRSDVFNSIDDPFELSGAISQGIENLVHIMREPTLTPGPSSPFSSSSSEVENPIFATRDEDLLPYQLFEPDRTQIPDCVSSTGEGSPCSSFRNYVRNRGFSLGAADWQNALNNALDVINNALEVVNRQRARTISVDGFTVLVRANQDFRGDTNALQGLLKIEENAQRIMNYLTDVGCKSRPSDCNDADEPLVTHRYFPQIRNVELTKKLTRQVIDLLVAGLSPGPLDQEVLPKECQTNVDEVRGFRSASDIEEKSFLVTSCITKLLKLAERGNDVYFTKVRSMVSYEMEARFRNGEFDGDVEDMIAATRGDLVNSLQRTLGGSQQLTLSEVTSGLESARYISTQTLKEFFEFFKGHIEQNLVVDPLRKAQKEMLCMRVLPYIIHAEYEDKWAARIDKACKNVKLNFYSDGASVSWRDIVKRGSRTTVLGNDRAQLGLASDKIEADAYCALRRYERQNFLYEQRRKKSDKIFSPTIDWKDLL